MHGAFVKKLSLVLLSTLWVATASAAPEPKPLQQDPAALQAEGVQQKAKFNEIERGFSVRLPVGVMAYLTQVHSVNGNFNKHYAPGLSIGLELGYDVLPWLDIGGFFTYSHTYGTDWGPTRDLNSGLGGIMARVSFFHTERFYLGVRAGVGYGYQDTSVEKIQSGVGVMGVFTAEYFTRIRHFSVALDAGAIAFFIPRAISVGLTITPSVRYTF